MQISLLVGWPGEKAGKCSRVGTNVRRPGSHRSTPSCLGALSAQALQPWRRLTSQWQTARASSCPSAAPATGPQAAVTCAHSLSRTKLHTDILYGPTTGVAHQSSVKVTGDSRSCSSEESAKWRFLFDLLWSHSQSGGPVPVQRLEVHTHHCLCIIRCLLNVSSVGGCIRLSIEIGDSCCSRGQKFAAEVGREGPSHRWVRI